MLDVPIDLDTLTSYPLSLVPLCLGIHDGFFAKTNKASILHFIMEGHDVEKQYPKGSMFIQDGNVLFNTLNNLSPTFGGICLQILDHMAAKQNFIFCRFLSPRLHQKSGKSTSWMRRKIHFAGISNKKAKRLQSIPD